MILWTFALVLVLGFVASTFLLQPPKTIQMAKRSKPTRVPAAALTTGVREEALDAQGTRQAAEVMLDCTTVTGPNVTATTLAENVTQLRLSGEACQELNKQRGDIVSTEVVNSTNGFSATVFHPSPRSFTTDYIALARGKNSIRIQHVLRKGQRLAREFTIERLQ